MDCGVVSVAVAVWFASCRVFAIDVVSAAVDVLHSVVSDVAVLSLHCSGVEGERTLRQRQ